MDLEPRQIGAETEVLADSEADVRIGRAVDLERVGVFEHGLVSVRRGIEQTEVLAGRDLLAVQLEILDGRPAELDHRRGPADDLLRRLRDEREIRPELRELSRVLDQSEHPAARGVAGRLVAGDDEKREVGEQLEGRDLAAPEIGVREDAHDVIGGIRRPGPSFGDHLGKVDVHLLEREPHLLARVTAADLVLRIARAGDLVRPFEHPAPVAPRDAEHVGEDRESERGREILDEVDLALLCDLVDEVVGDPFDLGAPACDRAGREPGAREIPILGVVGRIHVQEMSEDRAVGLRRVRRRAVGKDGDARRVSELRRLLREPDDVGAAGDGPETGARSHVEILDRRVAPERLPRGVRIAVGFELVGSEDLLGGQLVGGGHGCRSTRSLRASPCGVRGPRASRRGSARSCRSDRCLRPGPRRTS